MPFYHIAKLTITIDSYKGILLKQKELINAVVSLPGTTLNFFLLTQQGHLCSYSILQNKKK